MKKLLPLSMAFFLLSSLSFAQSNDPNIIIVVGELQRSLDVTTARIGDEIVIKASKNVMRDGKVFVAKSSKILGQVANVEARSPINGGSSISVRFDRIDDNGKVTQIRSFVSSIVSIDGKLRSAESDHDRAVAAFVKQSAPYEQRTYASQRNPAGLLNPNGGQGNPTGYVKKGADPALPNSPRTFDELENVARNRPANVTEISIAQDAEGTSTVRKGVGSLKIAKWTTFKLVIGM